MTQVIIGKSGKSPDRLLSVAAAAFGVEHGARLSVRAPAASAINLTSSSVSPSVGHTPNV